MTDTPKGYDDCVCEGDGTLDVEEHAGWIKVIPCPGCAMRAERDALRAALEGIPCLELRRTDWEAEPSKGPCPARYPNSVHWCDNCLAKRALNRAQGLEGDRP